MFTAAATLSVFLFGTWKLKSVFERTEETRIYNFAPEDGPDRPIAVKLEAPNGFVEGKEAVIKPTPIHSEYYMGYNIMIMPMKGGTAKKLKGEEANKYMIDQLEKTPQSLELEKNTKLMVNFMQGKSVENQDGRVKEIDVEENRRDQFLVAVVALGALCLTIPSGISAFLSL